MRAYYNMSFRHCNSHWFDVKMFSIYWGSNWITKINLPKFLKNK